MTNDPHIEKVEDVADASAERRFADLFDVRRVIAALFAIYGVILLVLGVFASADVDRSQGFNVNLWVGLALLVTAAGFMAWARRTPLGEALTRPDAEGPRS